jgi:hypothetical protein
VQFRTADDLGFYNMFMLCLPFGLAWYDGSKGVVPKKIVERRANMAEGSMEGDHEITAQIQRYGEEDGSAEGGGGGGEKEKLD